MAFVYLSLVYANNSTGKSISTQHQMAEDLGISRRTICKIESGEQNVSLDYAYRISAYFNLLVQEVFPVMTKETIKNSNG